MKNLYTVMFCLLIVGCERYSSETLTEIPPDVQKSIQSAVDGKHRPGVVIGLINPKGKFFYAYGTAIAGEVKPLTDNSQFAIGSLTKLFTVEVLNSLVESQILKYQTKVQDIWPDIDDGSQTELWHLASHQAALPRKIPFKALNNNNPVPLLNTLRRTESLPADYAYSNAGMALLGLTLAKTRETDLVSLMNKTVLQPLGLPLTRYHPDPQRVVGLHRVMEPVLGSSQATVEVARGAGGLYSTVSDLLNFLRFQINERDINIQKMDKKLGWKKHQGDSFISYYHGGEGNGNQAFIGYRPDNKVGVVLLSNSSADDDLQTIALHFLDPSIQLPGFDHHPARKYTDDELAPFVGVYYVKDDPGGNSFSFQNNEGSMLYIEKTADNELVRRTRMLGIDKNIFKLAEMPLTVNFLGSETDQYDAIMEFQDQVYYLVKKSHD